MIHKKYRLFYELLGGAVLLSIGVAIGAGFFDRNNRNDYHMNLATEALGIVATVFIINRWYAHRDRERARMQERKETEIHTEELKRRLVREARSGANDVAIRAIERLRENGWLVGHKSLLKGENLSDANLHQADLRYANLRRANMEYARLQNSDMSNASLRQVSLRGANLRGSYIFSARLHGAELGFANLQGAKLTGANLRRAKVRHADFRGAFLIGTNLCGVMWYRTIMPDGTQWSSANDLGRFTDYGHPDFETTYQTILEVRKAFKIEDDRFPSTLA